MPCTSDGHPTFDEVAHRERSEYKAMLCGVFSVLEKSGTLLSTLQKVNEKECGISYVSMLAWWERHKRLDRERIEQEKRQAEQEKRRKAAFDKLTPEERALLGVRK